MGRRSVGVRGGVSKPPVDAAFEVTDDMTGRVQMALRGILEVAGHEADSRSDVRTSGGGEPD